MHRQLKNPFLCPHRHRHRSQLKQSNPSVSSPTAVGDAAAMFPKQCAFCSFTGTRSKGNAQQTPFRWTEEKAVKWLCSLLAPITLYTNPQGGKNQHLLAFHQHAAVVGIPSACKPPPVQWPAITIWLTAHNFLCSYNITNVVFVFMHLRQKEVDHRTTSSVTVLECCLVLGNRQRPCKTFSKGTSQIFPTKADMLCAHLSSARKRAPTSSLQLCGTDLIYRTLWAKPHNVPMATCTKGSEQNPKLGLLLGIIIIETDVCWSLWSLKKHKNSSQELRWRRPSDTGNSIHLHSVKY